MLRLLALQGYLLTPCSKIADHLQELFVIAGRQSCGILSQPGLYNTRYNTHCFTRFTRPPLLVSLSHLVTHLAISLPIRRNAYVRLRETEAEGDYRKGLSLVLSRNSCRNKECLKQAENFTPSCPYKQIDIDLLVVEVRLANSSYLTLTSACSCTPLTVMFRNKLRYECHKDWNIIVHGARFIAKSPGSYDMCQPRLR